MIPGWKIGLAAGALVLAFAGGYAAHRRPSAPAVALREDTEAQKASASASDRKDEKGAGRVTTTVEEFGGGTGMGAPLVTTPTQRESPAVTSSVAPAAPTTEHLTRRTVTVEERGPEVITEHAAETTASAEQSHLSLTVTPAPAPPGWAVGVALDDLPGTRLLRLELDRRLVGNLWLTAGVVPARREVGLGLRMEW